MPDPLMAKVRELREMGAVSISVSDSSVSVAFAGPPDSPEQVGADDVLKKRNHLSLSETDREELARLRERYQMDEELGVD